MKKEELKQIVTIQIEGIQRLLREQKITIELSPAAQERIVTVGYDPAYGARPLKRAIQRELQNPIATMILENTFTAGDKIVVDCVDEKLIFDKEPTSEAVELEVAQPAEPLKSIKPKKVKKNLKQPAENQTIAKPKPDEQPKVVSSET